MLRLATVDDFCAIHAIYMHPAVAAALERPVVDAEQFQPIYADLLQRPNLYVYTVDAEIVGCFHLSRHSGAGSDVAHLSPFIVSPAWQGQGHGRRMLGELIVHASGAGIRRLQLFVARRNVKAFALYQAHGFFIEGGAPSGTGSEYYMGLALAP